MDLVVIAQLITGTATLIVALVLVFQLKQQNDQLKLQQKDYIKRYGIFFKTWINHNNQFVKLMSQS